MKLVETYIVWSDLHGNHVKLHKTSGSDGTGIKWYTEVSGALIQVSWDDAMELLNQ